MNPSGAGVVIQKITVYMDLYYITEHVDSKEEAELKLRERYEQEADKFKSQGREFTFDNCSTFQPLYSTIYTTGKKIGRITQTFPSGTTYCVFYPTDA